MAIKLIEVELTEEIQPIRELKEYEGVRILVRYHGRPVAWAYFNNEPWQQTLSADRVRQLIVEQKGWELLLATLDKQFEPVTDNYQPPISVVICTRDRTELLKGALESLLALDYPQREIIVVDNAPSNNSTAEFVARFPVRYVKEERPGLDWARNRGIAEAKHEIIAFTDDDARPDRNWLRVMAAAFADPEVMAASGLVSASELETLPQEHFELVYGGMLQYLHKFKVWGDRLSVKDLLWACNYGVGANMAFRRQIFEAVGNFDVALDVGTATRGAGDVEMFHRILAKGYATLYDPSALVWHLHRRSEQALSRQLQDNGRSFGAYLLTCDRNRTVTRPELLKFVAKEWFGWWLLRRLRAPGKLPRKYVVSEILGALQSPFAYREAQLQARKLIALAEVEPTTVEQPVIAGGLQ
jgi:glycosyltransferase involved in cell wall biosynthesis